MAGTGLALAQDVTIEKKVDKPAVTVPAPRVEERKDITTARGGCDTKTVEKDTPAGQDKKTVKRCD
jgi:hypothetical protein